LPVATAFSGTALPKNHRVTLGSKAESFYPVEVKPANNGHARSKIPQQSGISIADVLSRNLLNLLPMISTNPEQESQCPGSSPKNGDKEDVFNRKACLLLVYSVHSKLLHSVLPEWFNGNECQKFSHIGKY